jgi:hypothetical protein
VFRSNPRAPSAARGGEAGRLGGLGYQDGAVRPSPVCFQLSPVGGTELHIDGVRLSAASAGALAELLQVLSCGEAREQLTQVLRLRADSLDSLAVDPDRLFARLRPSAAAGRAI